MPLKKRSRTKKEVKDDRLQLVEQVKATSFSPEGLAYRLLSREVFNDHYVIVKIEKRGGEHIVDVRDQSVQRFQDQYFDITRYEDIKYLADGYWRVERVEDPEEFEVFEGSSTVSDKSKAKKPAYYMGNVGVFDSDFKEFLPSVFHDIQYSEGYFYTANKGEPGLVRIFDKKGLLTKDEYHKRIGYFSDGLLLLEKMVVDEENTKHREYYFIDKTGKVSIDLPKMGFDDARAFHDGRAAVENVKGYWGYLNTQGELVVNDEYKLAFDYFPESHCALVQDQEGVFKFIDENGSVKATIGKNWCNVIRNENSRQYNSDYPNARVVVVDEGLYYDAYGKVINAKK